MTAFKFDENLPVESAVLFADAGYDSLTVSDQQMQGDLDSSIAAVCQAEHRVLVSLDLGFADIRVYPPDQYPGIIVLRLQSQSKPHVLSALQRLLLLLTTEPLEKRLWIVDEHSVRIRN